MTHDTACGAEKFVRMDMSGAAVDSRRHEGLSADDMRLEMSLRVRARAAGADHSSAFSIVHVLRTSQHRRSGNSQALQLTCETPGEHFPATHHPGAEAPRPVHFAAACRSSPCCCFPIAA